MARLGDGRTELVVDGHEDHLEQGRVCAAVSAVVSTALLGLAEIARQYPSIVTVHLQETTPQ